ncbi:DUF1080 domain-containing protein [Opitutia bacterium ISCC 51]|nr:DUF1080 domain-containing protein [Opitutae bacterium ISCC 51]QXD26887.1 DUF1080 domain-containing protein [Opitutae bacterium ISCC 52]
MKILPYLTLSLIASLLVGCGSATEESSNTLSLFNGENLDGWEIQNGGQFSVADGVLTINKGTGWLRSADTFGDFTLTMEFRFMEKGANSGIFVRTGPTSNDDENGWPNNGYQVQCLDEIEHQYPLGFIIPYGAPEFQSESSLDALKSVYKPALEWHTYEITCLGETMEVKLNGTVITTCTSIKNLTGHIGIQGELGHLEFRKIEVTQL